MPLVVVHEAVFVEIPWIERGQWRKTLARKAGALWLPDDPDRNLHMEWLNWAPIGSAKHAEEDLWIEIEEKAGDSDQFVLIANYIDQCYKAVRLTISFKPTIDVNELD